MKNKDLIELKIEKLTYGGEGLGRFEGITVFVPDTAPGDKIKAEIVSMKKNMAKAFISEIIEPSKHRVKSFCSLANACGGCQWQHISYDEQLRAKKIIIEENMQKIAGIKISVKDVIGSDEIKEYRGKVQYPVQQTKVSKRFLAGYYRKNTHEIVNIKYCPIQPEIIDKITKFLREKAQELNLTAYNEQKNKGLIRHFVFRYSRTNKNLVLTIVINDEKINAELIELCRAVKNEFSEIVGVLANFNTSCSNLIMGKQTELVHGLDYIEEILDEKIFHISADSFFQVNTLAARKMFSVVRNIVENLLTNDTTVPLNLIQDLSDSEKILKSPNKQIPNQVRNVNLKKPSILDVYAGSGSFSIYLHDLAENITAVEESESSIKDGLENLKINEINNISFIKGKAETVLKNLSKKMEKYDVVILDPPRKGCSESVLESVKQLAGKYLIYVSCNPTTLARDVKLLSENFNPLYIQPVDMFCHTYHIESILVMKKL